MNDDAPNAHRTPLYQPAWHIAVRIVHGFFLLMYLAALVSIAVRPPKQFTWNEVGGLVMLLIFPWFATLVFRTRQIYGSIDGLAYNEKKSWITVPWSKVDAIKYAWWSSSRLTRIGRMAVLHVAGKTTPIYFYANDRILADLFALRDKAT